MKNHKGKGFCKCAGWQQKMIRFFIRPKASAMMVILCAVMILAGCQMNPANAPQEYRLAGVLVTTDWLGHEQIYADPVTHNFFGVDGMAFFVRQGSHEAGTYTASHVDETIVSGGMHVHSSDYGVSITLEGTIYLAPEGFRGTVFSVNPVYQAADGSIFARVGNSMTSSGSYAEGQRISQTLTSTHTITESGRTRVGSTSVTISVGIMYAPERVVVLQMDSGSDVISRTEFAPGAMPDEITPESEVEFFIVETHSVSYAGDARVARSIYGREDERFETFSARHDGVMVKRSIRIIW